MPKYAPLIGFDVKRTDFFKLLSSSTRAFMKRKKNKKNYLKRKEKKKKKISFKSLVTFAAAD